MYMSSLTDHVKISVYVAIVISNGWQAMINVTVLSCVLGAFNKMY